MCPIWARLSVRIQDRFLAVPQESAFPKDALFLVRLNLCFAWMPFEVGASRLSYQKPGQVFYNYKRECPHADGLALTLEFAVEKADRACGDESSAQVLFDFAFLMKSFCFKLFVCIFFSLLGLRR